MAETSKEGKKLKLVEVLKQFALGGASAAESAAKACSDTVLEFFEKDGTPVMQTLKVGEKAIKVPKICLINPPSLMSDETAIAFSVSVNIDQNEGICMHNHFNLLQKGINVDVSMKFKGVESPEGLELIRDRLNKELSDNLEQPQGRSE